jgi:hypothetical protein
MKQGLYCLITSENYNRSIQLHENLKSIGRKERERAIERRESEGGEVRDSTI